MVFNFENFEKKNLWKIFGEINFWTVKWFKIGTSFGTLGTALKYFEDENFQFLIYSHDFECPYDT